MLGMILILYVEHKSMILLRAHECGGGVDLIVESAWRCGDPGSVSLTQLRRNMCKI